MSGTSADGVEAVLANFQGATSQPSWQLLNQVSIPYPTSLTKKVIDLGQGEPFSASEWLEIAEGITKIHVQAALTCDPQERAQVVGCHGQTVFHRPPSSTQNGASLQLMQASLLAESLKRPVVNDFRAKDLALGGEGAPLVPNLDAALLGRGVGWRALLNLGGIANLTLIPPHSGPDRLRPVLGWDCGPANTLIDLAIQAKSQGSVLCDVDGRIAMNGSALEETIQLWLKEPFFQKPPPKSTGREQFGRSDLARRVEEIGNVSLEDLLATLTAFTAAVVSQDLEYIYRKFSIRPIELLLAGGGSCNPVMVREIVHRCPGICVQKLDEYGIPNQAREALAFALLAWWHLREHPGNSPAITGAKRLAVLGNRVNP